MALTAEVGVPTSLDVWTDAGFSGPPPVPSQADDPENIPPGLAWVVATRTLDGTPTTEGEYAVTVYTTDPLGNPIPGTSNVTITGGEPTPDPDPPGTARAVTVEGMFTSLDLRAALGLDLPELVDATAAPLPAGLVHNGSGVLTGTPTAPGEVTVELRDSSDTLLGTVVILVLPEGSQVSEDPWDLWDNLAAALAPRVAAIVGKQGDTEAVALATAQLPLVAEYVRGYTRGRGFEGDAPAGPLRAVIVSATARLATNPEQVSVYTMGDYSERPAQLAGWTLAEIGVLHRYRIVTA